MATTTSVSEALAYQASSCDALGSPLYATLLRGLRADHDAGGLTADLLRDRTDRPVHDALALRLLGGVHRIVLEGRAPALAAFYPSVGGIATGDPTRTFLEVCEQHRDEVEASLARNVQTNEVGRAAALVGGFTLVARRTRLPLRVREVGSSAGLLLNWDRYAYDTGRSRTGDPASPVRFEPSAWQTPPDLSGDCIVADRRGCDVNPIDPTSDDGRLTLLSFVWPDQGARFRRLRDALDVATRHSVTIDAADAGVWLEHELAHRTPGLATVVHHSIVLQYLSPASLEHLRRALRTAGERATADAPLAWLRMEPAGPVADIRLTTWPGAHEVVLGTTGYHGQDVRWSLSD